MACVIKLANYTTGMSAITWTLVSDIAPHELVGVDGGVFILLFVGVFAIIGAASYIFIVGEVCSIELNR